MCERRGVYAHPRYLGELRWGTAHDQVSDMMMTLSLESLTSRDESMDAGELLGLSCLDNN